MDNLTANIRDIAEKLDNVDISSQGEKNYVGFDIAVENAIWSIKAAMFPKFFGSERFGYDVGIKRQTELAKAYDEIQKCLRYILKDEDEIKAQAANLIGRLPEIMDAVNTDVTAAYEVILTYRPSTPLPSTGSPMNSMWQVCPYFPVR